MKLLLIVLVICAFAVDAYERLDACNVEIPATEVPHQLSGFRGRRSQVCTFQAVTSDSNQIKITFNGLREACELKRDSVIVKEEGEISVNMCDSDSNVYISVSQAILVRYYTATDVQFTVSNINNKLPCVESLTYEHFGRSLTLSTRPVNQTCYITFPGRVRLIIEELNLASTDCSKSAASVLTGSEFYKYEYRLSKYCKQDNGVLALERKVKCPRGLLVVKSESTQVDSIRFRLEMPTEEEMSAYRIHDLDC